MPKAIDETGKVYGRLTVIERDLTRKGGAAYWICMCNCNAENPNIISIRGASLRCGDSQSCGCLMKELSSKANVKDLTGMTFNRLTVLYRDLSKIKDTNAVWWVCRCSCDGNNLISVLGDSLRKGDTSSCGCYQREQASKIHTKDLTGKRFGKLTVLKRNGSIVRGGHSYAAWDCVCSCNNKNIVTVISTDLIKNWVSSCGCLKSRGEQKITEILQENNINFKKEISFLDLISEKYCSLRFDFGIYENNALLYLLEYQGEQHYEFVEHFHKTEEGFRYRQKCDKQKEDYCKQNNIPLIIIPYTKFDTLSLEDLTLATTTFLYNPQENQEEKE